MDPESRRPTHSVTTTPLEKTPSASPFASGVYRRLLDEGYRFNFFQAVRLLELLEPGAPGPGETNDRERIELLPSPALVFPPTDIKRIERLDSGRIRLRATFHGLYGIDSPLPYYFYDRLATEDPETDTLREFLDVFNHRFYSFLYRAWKKYRPALQHRSDGRDASSRRFLALTGLGTAHATDEVPGPPLRLAALAGLLGPRTRSAAGLQAFIRAVFDDMPVTVIENVGRWVPMPTRQGLGGRLRLGQNTTVGERVYDRSGKFRLCLGPMDVEQYLALLPGGDDAEALAQMVRLYAPDPLDFDVELRIRSEELPETRLGATSARLGLTTSAGQPREPVLRRVVSYDGARS